MNRSYHQRGQPAVVDRANAAGGAIHDTGRYSRIGRAMVGVMVAAFCLAPGVASSQNNATHAPPPVVTAQPHDQTHSQAQRHTALPTQPPSQTPVWRDDAWVGIIAPAQVVDIAAGLSGELAQVHVQVGDRVEAGQLLATIDAGLLQEELKIAQAALATARAELSSNRTQYQHNRQRAQRLQQAAQIVSREERETATAEMAMAASARDAAAARVAEKQGEIQRLQRRLQHAAVRAPFTGIINLRHYESGARVNENAALFSLMAPQQLVVRFAVPSTAAAGLNVGATVAVSLGTQAERFPARVSWIAPSVDVATQMVFAEAVVDSHDAQLRAGLEAWVEPMPTTAGHSTSGAADRSAHLAERS